MANLGFLLHLALLALVIRSSSSADQCTPESLPDSPPAPPRSITSRLPDLALRGPASSKPPSISGDHPPPTYFNVELFHASSSTVDDSVTGFIYLSSGSSSLSAAPLKRWNPRFHPVQARRIPLRGSITGWFNSRSKLLCAKVCFTRSRNGTSTRVCDSLLSLQYPETRTIESLYAPGELRSLLQESDEGYFSPVSLTGVSNQEYKYTKLELAESSCSAPGDSSSSVLRNSSVESWICQSGLSSVPLNISGTKRCERDSCYPFLEANRSSSLFINDLRCHPGGRVTGFLQLREIWGQEFLRFGKNVLAVEGKWLRDRDRDRLCMVACQTQTRNTSRDCSIFATLEFPREFNIHQRSPVVGALSSLRNHSDPRYFTPFPFRAAGGQMFQFFIHTPGAFSYSYSKIEEAKQQCPVSGSGGNSSGEFPRGEYFEDFSFQSFTTRTSVYQVSLNNRLPWSSRYYQVSGPRVIGDEPKPLGGHSMVNVSFDIVIDGEFIAAEGFYDPSRGTACMIGCRELKPGKVSRNEELLLLEKGKDCMVSVRIQYPSSSEAPEKRKISATISSLRKKKDELFFKTIRLTSYQSMYMAEAIRSVWMMDLEIFFSLITLSLELLALVFQLVHSRRDIRSRRYASLVMLGVLILGHIVPLVLNFEEFFKSEDRSIAIAPGNTVEFLRVKEVAIRVMNMAALLLLLWLLQLVWSSRLVEAEAPSAELSTFHEESRLLEESNQKEFKVVEESGAPLVREASVLLVCLPLYLVGALATSLRQWILHRNLWSGMKSYAGLTLDLFLVPQVLAYSMWGVGARFRGLSGVFCVGMTIARILPHAFDIFREFRPSLEVIQVDYFFANPEWDFFSLAWDIAIPFVGIIVAALVLLQQRFGGRCFIPGFILQKFH